MGGRDIASSIPLPGTSVWSREYPVTCNAIFFLGLTGVPEVELGVMISAVTTAPRLVHFSVHATRRKLGETECSRVRFLDMAVEEDGVRVAAEIIEVVSEKMVVWGHPLSPQQLGCKRGVEAG